MEPGSSAFSSEGGGQQSHKRALPQEEELSKLRRVSNQSDTASSRQAGQEIPARHSAPASYDQAVAAGQSPKLPSQTSDPSVRWRSSTGSTHQWEGHVPGRLLTLHSVVSWERALKP